MIERLRECFTEDFTQWLLKSNNPKVGSIFKFLIQHNFVEDRHKDMWVRVENESLQEILDILQREPLADYFWYTYKEHGGGLTYALPHHDVVPSDALRIDKEKIKVFLRDIKIETILDEQS
jgi:hypothetical protein